MPRVMANCQQSAPPTQCPESCCQPTDLLCISIPCPVEIVLLGAIDLTVELPCLRISSTAALTPEQIAAIIAFLRRLLGGLLGGGQGVAAEA